VDGDKLIGVLTGYSATENGFDDMHEYTFEQVAGMLTVRLQILRENKSSKVVSFRSQKQQ
jgi:hypothetical protein